MKTILYYNPRVPRRVDPAVAAYMHELHSGVVAEAGRLGYAVLSLGREAGPGPSVRRRIVGAIGLVYPQDAFAPAWRRLGRRLPCVDLTVKGPDPNTPYVGTDDGAGMELIVDHLVATGRKRLAFFAVNDQSYVHDRARGFASARRRHRLPEKRGWIRLPSRGPSLDHLGPRFNRAVRLALDPWWDGLGSEKPEALCAENDRVAALVYDWAQGRGLSVPADLALTGFDDTPVSVGGAGYNTLTTIHQERARLGACAVRLLHEGLTGVTPRRRLLLLPPRLVTRTTTRVPARPTAAKRQTFLERCEELLGRHLDEPLPSRPLAQAFGLELPYFLAKFRRLSGVGFSKRLATMRLDRAAFELGHNTRPITEIQHACGYQTHQAFCRAFKARFGKTPGLWRAAQGTAGLPTQKKKTGKE